MLGLLAPLLFIPPPLQAVEPDSTIRKLTFLEFWEALVRCALVAYTKVRASASEHNIELIYMLFLLSVIRCAFNHTYQCRSFTI